MNRAILLGRLGQDPETRYTPNGAAVTTASLATSEKWKDRDGNKQESTEWHRLVFWRKLAEIASKYLTKGSQILVEGKIQTRSWEDRDGVKRYTTEIVVQSMTMLGSPQRKREERPAAYEPPPPTQPGTVEDDDIPF